MAKLKEKRKKPSLSEEVAEEIIPISKKREKVETQEVKIKMIGENPDQKTAPVIGYFPAGYGPLKNFDDTDSGVKIYKNANSRNPKNPRMQLVVGVNWSQVNFVATNYSGEATTPQLCNYTLGLLDKETRVLKMVPIAANKIFRLEPNVVKMELPENEPVADKFKYSTKKDIRRDKKYEDLRQMEGPGTLDDLDEKLEGIEVKTEALDAIASTTNARNVPPYDLDAISPDMAYPLDKRKGSGITF